MSETEIRKRLDSIIAFAGLEDVIDEPFHTYSSGMQARLAFAAAISVDADVIIIDEALAAGDVRFSTKSLRRIYEICKSGVTSLFVSHTTYHVMQLCTRAIWIDGGRIRMDGPPIEVVRAYEYEMHEAIARDEGRTIDRTKSLIRTVAADVEAQSVVPRKPEDGSTIKPLQKPDAPMKPGEGPEIPGAHALPSDRTREPATASSDGASEQTPRSLPIANPEFTVNSNILNAFERAQGAATAFETERQFTAGQYRILDVAFVDRNEKQATAFRFGEVLKLRVTYGCLLSELPEHSCGLAVTFHRKSDFEPIMYFSTAYAHSEAELTRYFEAPFRKLVARRGMIEAVIDPIQLRADEYCISIGLLPNRPGMPGLHEHLHCHYRIVILPNGFDEPAMFYPMVSWMNKPLDEQ